MAASLSDLFDGAQTADGTSAAQAITAGDWILVVQGTADGASVVLEGNVFDSSYDTLDGIYAGTAACTGFRAFRMCAGNVRATLVNAGASTSLKVGVLAAV